jgi:hypothetical protein
MTSSVPFSALGDYLPGDNRAIGIRVLYNMVLGTAPDVEVPTHSGIQELMLGASVRVAL